MARFHFKYIPYVVSLLSIILASVCCQCSEPMVIKPLATFNLAPSILEPSDVCIHPNGESLLIVSDKGYLFHTDTFGTALRPALYIGGDLEGVWTQSDKVFVVDESERLVHTLSADSLKVERSIHVPYGGKRNSGFESITYNYARDVFILITEKNPVIIFELDGNFTITRGVPFAVASDISAATWYNNHLWLLSDEDRMILKLNPENYKVIKRWYIPDVVKPEGIAFLNEQTMVIVCDKEHKLYHFSNPH